MQERLNSNDIDYIRNWNEITIEELEKDLLARFHDYTVSDRNHNLIDVAVLAMFLWVRAMTKENSGPAHPTIE